MARAGRLDGRTRAAILIVVVATACGTDLGTPHPRPLPPLDTQPALLGDQAPRSPRIANYVLEATLDDLNHRVRGKETLTWTNAGSSPVDRIPFHLYLNAFKNESSLFMTSMHGHRRDNDATLTTGWGFIDVEKITIAGGTTELHPDAPSDTGDETVMTVALPTPVAPGASISIAMEFAAQLPEAMTRTGYKDAFSMIAQWFPKVGVRVGLPGFEQWVCDPMNVNSEFFADFGTYDVRLTVPATLVVAATGVLTNAVDNGDGSHTLTYHAEDVHDFVWMTDPFMKQLSGTAHVTDHDVDVRVLFREPQREFAQRHLIAAIGAVEEFSKRFVPYPWTSMTVVDPPMDCADTLGGMEYPTLVTTAGDSVFMRPGIRWPEAVTIHEVGHNWFQGILASNEGQEAWLDEGVNEWADSTVMNHLYGDNRSGFDWHGLAAGYFEVRRAASSAFAEMSSPIATATTGFVDNSTYSELSYDKTMMALRTLELEVGNVEFAKAMQHYAQTWAFRHPTGTALLTGLAADLHRDLSRFVAPAFYDVGSTAFEVHSIDCDPKHEPRGVFGHGDTAKIISESESENSGAWDCNVVVQNTGTVHVAVDVEIHFADGTSQRVRWPDDDDGHWHRFHLERSSRVTDVTIDPDNAILLSDDRMEYSHREHGSVRASARAAARIGFWQQSLMTVMGL